MICVTYLRRVIPPLGDVWIPFTAAEVAARRAAQMVLVIVCVSATPWSASAPELDRPCDCAVPFSLPPDDLIVPWAPPVDVTDIPAPASAAVFGVGVLGLWWMVRRRPRG